MSVELTTKIIAASPAAAGEAARCLAGGGLVAFPTETVYGLGADATLPEAIARLYRAKGRPSFNPLIAHVPDRAAAERIGRFNAAARKLADAFWPGPLTRVLPKTPDCPVAALATAGLDTVAVRIPAHPVAKDILRELGHPVVAPSANRSGHVSPTTAAHVESDLAGRIDLIVDGGPVPVASNRPLSAVSTTRRCCCGPAACARRHRAGAGTPAAATAAAGQCRRPADGPGMLASHYAPRTPVRLNATQLAPGEALLAFRTGGYPRTRCCRKNPQPLGARRSR